MRIALAQVDCIVGDLSENCKKFSKYAALAREADCEVVIFPEMTDTGYVTSVAAESAQPWPGRCFDGASSAAATNAIHIICGLSEKQNECVYNSIAVFDTTGQLQAKYRKLHLFSPGPAYEDRFFTRGESLCLVSIGGAVWGITICYDLRFPELYRALALEGAQVLLNCSAWPASRPAHWDVLTKARAIENQAFFIGVGRVGGGNDGETPKNGASCIISPTGDVLAEGSQEKEELIVGELDFTQVKEFRSRIPSLKSYRADIFG
ncbi:MAG: hypothetical protein KDD70_17185 [Bdellovibrionales bacterium]|nr:hypothetical protein [Bdellovibrionales bacterium]